MEDTAQCENRVVDVRQTATTGLATATLAMRPGIDYPLPPAEVSRKRLKELYALAFETVEWLEKKGLKRGEQCEFRQIAERIWFKD